MEVLSIKVREKMVIPHAERRKLEWKVVFEKRVRNLHLNITFNVLAGYPGGNTYIGDSWETGTILWMKQSKKQKLEVERWRELWINDLRVRMTGLNKIPDTR